MKKVIECVPNFSEGRDLAIIKQITDVIESVQGIRLLDVDPGESTNRTVVTFIGEPEPVKEAAFRAVQKAADLIDMSKHHGEHARFGATDVCPFVPVSGATMEDCVEIAREVGKRIGDELEIPVYLYEHAASKPERQNLAKVRAGEYEGLAKKLADPDWKPDFGPAEFNAGAGATAVGAREFLIAYNINLNTGHGVANGRSILNLTEPAVGTFECKAHAEWSGWVEQVRYFGCKGTEEFEGKRMRVWATDEANPMSGEYQGTAEIW